MLVRVLGRPFLRFLFYYSMRWSLAFLLFLLPLSALAGKLRKRKCNQPGLTAPNTTRTVTNTTNSAANTANTYILQDLYQGESFLTEWEFYSASDPTHGNVNYVTQQEAVQKGLAVVQNDVAIFSADDTTWLGVGGLRNSVRLTSTKSYSGGVFIADFKSLPYGCGLWPAYWSTGPNWPHAGEIDVVEGVSNNLQNQMTLHTGQACSMPQSAASLATGSQLSTNCLTTQGSNSGCAFLDPSSSSFGANFNNAGGGVFAHVWTDKGISIWHFPRASIPQDITAKKPNPSQWGRPVADFPSTECDIASNFFDHNLILDITICGDWAGSAYPASCPGTCATAVANPTNFKNAKFEVNYIAVYQLKT